MARSLTARTGMSAAFAAALFALAYVAAQLFEWFGLLGSAGGPNAASTPLGLMILLLPSLLLGSAHLIMIAALHEAVSAERKVLSLSALGFATGYAVLTGLVYFVQLTFVAPRLAAGKVAGIELLLFVPYESFLFAVDLLGYSFMCLSCLLAGLALKDQADAATVRRWLVLTGLLAPALALQMAFPWLIWGGALWAITYPLASIAACRWFAR
jgi:hypothetical protein